MTAQRVLVIEPKGRIRVDETISPADEGPDSRAPTRGRVASYFALTKPRIIELLLVTTLPAMVVAANGVPPLDLAFWTLLGGALSAGGANAINCYVDRDIDRVMPRTKRRPLPAEEIDPRRALAFGTALGTIAFLLLWAMVNLASALIATAALAFYVFVYTIVMKRSTPQNIVIGGAAGAAPVLVGWSAVTGTVEVPALMMFGIIFYWTPPHFWALAMRYEKEYAAAGVPMMPVVYGRKETAKHIVLYSLLLLALCLALYSVAQLAWIYLFAALSLNVAFIALSVKLYRDTTPRVAWTLFRFSIYYLALLFAAMAADRIILS